MKIILASQSPRRKVLLELMGLKFEVIPSNFEEYFDETRSVEEVVKELGLGKAMDVANSLSRNVLDSEQCVVIGSDLIVVVDGRQIGKPESEQEAKDMLRMLSGRTHQLIASVAVVCLGQNYQKVATETSELTFDEFSDEFIDEYVATGTTYDKAGGYAMQHPLVAPHVVAVGGRRDTIIGMPTNLVAQFLSDFGIEANLLEDKDIINNQHLFS
jgi:septum formation protein